MVKRILLVSVLCLWVMNIMAQKNNASGVIRPTEFHVTRPIRDIFKENPVDENAPSKKKMKESGDRTFRSAQHFEFTAKDGPQYGNAPEVMQTEMGKESGGTTKASWGGQTASGFRPYDPSGAVGPNHYVQMINSTTFKIYNKTGTVLLTGTLGNLWSPATANAGDPVVMYDKAADRWFLAQFGSSTDKKIYIAISQTNDPTGAYYTYTYVSPAFPDYLKFGVWSDGYYMTSNQVQKVFAFERTAMLAGTPGARSIYTSFTPPQGSGFFCPMPGDAADGTLPPAGSPCPIFSYSDNGWGASYSDAINIYQMAVNWTPTTPTATITAAAAIPTAAFDASYNASWNDCSQPGTTQKLDGIGGIVMYRTQWKSWSGYNTVVLNWGVNISASQRSIKWAELRQNQSTGTWSLFQEGIYTPDAATRWMGSIAMDNNGSIGLSYIKSDATSIYPGLYYTGRRECDPLGTLPVTEVQVIAGTGYQTGTNRVGDYSHTTLDVDGLTFWNTSEYMGGTSGGSAARTQIFSYQIAPCGNNASVSIALTSGTNPTCTGNSMTFTATPYNGGSAPSYQWKVNGTNVGTNSPTFTTNSITNGQVVTCVMTSNLAGVTNNPATSSPYSVTVNSAVTPSVSIALTNGSNPTCAGAALTFTATPTNGGTGPSYQWKVNGSNVGTNSSTFTTSTLTNGQIITCVLTSSELCASPSTSTSNGITVNITTNTTPSISIAQTTGSNPLCAGTSATFTATPTNATSPTYQWKVNGSNVGTNAASFTTSSLTNGQIVSCDMSSQAICPSIITLGTGTTYNTTTTDAGVAYPTYYGNARQQYLIRASELTALGMVAGNINSLGFTVGGTIGNPATLNGYSIRLATTSATVLTSTFQTPAFTTVYGPTNYTPTLNSINTHSFSSPFYWNGTSNLIVEICFSNQVVGYTAYQVLQTTAAFVATTYYRADGTAGAGACTQATGTGTSSVRPNMIFTSGSTQTTTSNSITMSVNTSVTPSVTIAVTSGNNPMCAGNPITFTATPTNGGTTPSYVWKIGSTTVGTNSNTYTNNNISNLASVTCTMTSNESCASPSSTSSSPIVVSVNSLPSVSASASNASICVGGSSSLSASGASTYTWMPGSFSGASVTVSPTSTTTYTVTGADANGCANTATVLVTVNSLPSVSASASNASICVGGSSSLSASGASTYTWMPGSLSGASVSVSPTSTTTYTVSGADANGCANTATVLVTVNSLPSVSASASNASICVGGSSSLSASGASTYTWMPGSLSGASVTVSPTSTTTYTVTGADANSCVNTATVSVTVNSLPIVTASNVSGCNNITLIGSPLGGSFNVANPYTGPSTTYTYTYTDANGCTATSNSATITAGNSAEIALANAGNANSLIGTLCQTETQTNNSTVLFAASCTPIVMIQDQAAGSGPGNTQVCAQVVASNITATNGQIFAPRYYTITPSTSEAATITFYLTQDDCADYNANSGSMLPMPTSGSNSDPNITNVRVAQLSSGSILTDAFASITPIAMTWNSTDARWELTLASNASTGSYYFYTLPACNLSMPTVTVSNITSSSALLNWTSVSGAYEYNFRFRPVGSSTWNTSNPVTNTLTLNGLSASTTYEVQAKVRCNVNSSGLWGNVFTFTTTAATSSSCPIPTGLVVSNVTASSAQFNWNAMGSPVSSYVLRYRIIGSPTWNNAGCPTNSKLLSNLLQGNNYEVQVSSYCTSLSQQTAFTASVNFSTPAQCQVPTGIAATNITSNSVVIVWNALGAPTTSYVLRYRIQGSSTWLNAGCPTNSRYLGGLVSGATYQVQVQTYCASLSTLSAYSPIYTFATLGNACPVPTNLIASNITNTSALLTWTDVAPPASGNRYILRYRITGATSWNNAGCPVNSRTLNSLTPNTQYDVEVQSICSATFNSSAFTSTYRFQTTETAAKDNSGEVYAEPIALSSPATIYPNPTNGKFQVEIRDCRSKEIRVELYDLQGRLFQQKRTFSANDNTTIDMELNEFAGSTFIVKVYTDKSLVLVERVRKTE